MRLAFFCSYNGSSMLEIVKACQSGNLHAKPCVVISNNSRSPALSFARAHGLDAQHLSRMTHPDEDQLDTATLNILETHSVTHIVLSGFMRKIRPQTLAAYAGKILNIHPGPLPQFGGPGMFGLHVHEAVLAANLSETEATVHLVTSDYDEGPIICSTTISVLRDDTPKTLAQRVKNREGTFFVETLSAVQRGEIDLATAQNIQPH